MSIERTTSSPVGQQTAGSVGRGSTIWSIVALTLIMSLGMGMPSRASAQTFLDVPLDYWAYNFIEGLAESGITAGCGGGNYCPENPVSRAQMAVFLERGMNGSDYSPPAATGNVFLDIGRGDFAASWIEQLYADGITAGCGNSSYCPDAEVSRAQMAVFLLRAIHGAGYSPPTATGAFGDVPPNHWAAAWIEQFAAEGITAGCGGGDYCPEAPVTRAQMAVFLLRAFSLPLEVEVTNNARPVEDGQALVISMSVSNPGLVSRTNVVLQASTPRYMSISPASEATPPGTCTTGSSTCSEGNIMEWSLGTLAPGDVRLIRFADAVSTAANEGDLMTTDVTVTGSGVSPIFDSRTIVVSEDAPPLQLAMTADHNPAAPGELVTYQLRYSNTSLLVTADSLSATVPLGTTFVSASSGATMQDGTVSWPVLIGGGFDGVREFTVMLDADLAEAQLLSSEASFEDSISSTAAIAKHVLAVADSPPLSLALVSNVDPAEDGSNAPTITMTVANNSSAPQANVNLQALTPLHMGISPASEAVPDGTCLTGSSTCASGDTISWALGTLAPGEVRVVRYADAITTAADDGELLTMDAILTASGVSPIQASQTIVVSELAPQLQLALSADHNPVAPGEVVTYRLQYSNLSTNLAADRLSATVPPGTTFVSATGGGMVQDDVVSWPVVIGGDISGAREFSVMLDGNLENGELLRAAASFGDSINDTVTSQNHVLAVAETSALDLEVTSTSDPAEDGKALTFTMTVSNPGTVALTNVNLQAITPFYMGISPTSEATPAGICFTGSTSCTSGDTMEWQLGTLQPGEVRVVRFADVVSSVAPDGPLLTTDVQVTTNGVTAARESHTVLVSELQSLLALRLMSDRNPVAPSDLITYRLRYSNISSTINANNLSASVPVGTTFVSATGGGTLVGDTVSWPVSIGGSVHGMREFTVMVDSTIPNGALLHTDAQFSDTVTEETATAENVTAVATATPLDLAITSSSDPVQDSSPTLTIRMVVSNPGLTTMTNVNLQALTPLNLNITPSSESTPAGICLTGSTNCAAGDVLQWTLGTMPPGDVRLVQYEDLVGSAAVDGSFLTADALVTTNGVPVVQASRSVVVSELAPPLNVVLSAPSPAAPGAQVTYRLDYANASTTLTANSLTARVPPGTTFVSATDGGVLTGDTVSWPIAVGPTTNGLREFTVSVGISVDSGQLLRSEAFFEDTLSGESSTSAHVLAIGF